MHKILTKQFKVLFFLLIISANTKIMSADLIVKVMSDSIDGNIGCSLFNSESGFPKDSKRAIQQYKYNSPVGTEFIFTNLESGNYAVSVMNDKNNNKTLDTNLFGIPVEEWGVSNNIRPTLREPTFEEALFSVEKNQNLELVIKISK